MKPRWHAITSLVAVSLTLPALAAEPVDFASDAWQAADGTAYFSNFTWRADDTLAFDPPPPVDTVPGIVRERQVSRPLPAARVDLELPPEAQSLGELGWQKVLAEPSGLVDVSRLHPRSGEPDVVFARAVIHAGNVPGL